MLPDVRPVHHPKEEPRQRRHARRGRKVTRIFQQMFNLSNSSASYNSNVTAPSTGADHAGWRAWWQAQTNRQGSDWPSLIGPHFTITDSLRSTSS